MSYIEYPNSFTTDAIIGADGHNSNFKAFQDGLRAGTKDIQVDEVSLANDLTTSACSCASSISVVGAMKGARVLFPYCQSNRYVKDWPDAVQSDGTDYGIDKEIVFSRDGSIVGWSAYFYRGTTSTTGTTQSIRFSISTPGGGASTYYDVGQMDVASNGTFTFYSQIARNTIAFTAGQVLKVIGSTSTGLPVAAADGTSAFMFEVQYDT